MLTGSQVQGRVAQLGLYSDEPECRRVLSDRAVSISRVVTNSVADGSYVAV